MKEMKSTVVVFFVVIIDFSAYRTTSRYQKLHV